jgi:hypothetical protein
LTDTTTSLTIREAVAESMNSLMGRTREQVVNHFASLEVEKQAKAVISGLEKLTGFENERRRIKPSYQGFDIDGKGVGDPFFSKEQVENNKKLGEQIEKLTKAINKADERNDFGDLYNLTK